MVNPKSRYNHDMIIRWASWWYTISVKHLWANRRDLSIRNQFFMRPLMELPPRLVIPNSRRWIFPVVKTYRAAVDILWWTCWAVYKCYLNILLGKATNDRDVWVGFPVCAGLGTQPRMFLPGHHHMKNNVAPARQNFTWILACATIWHGMEMFWKPTTKRYKSSHP